MRLALLLLSPVLFAQTSFHQLTTPPWNGDWLPIRKDTLVHGEDYRGYPGPLPKFLHAMGLDYQHPATTYELRFNIDRSAPFWYGQCHSWAAASAVYAEPESITLRGVRLDSAELKGLLSVFYEHGNPTIMAGGSQGLGADALEELLFANTAKNLPFILDIDLSEEVWNFPVASFAYFGAPEGEWTHVILDIGMVAAQEMRNVAQGDPLVFYKTYTYRFKTASRSNYQWTGDSIADHPKRAWFPKTQTTPAVWKIVANRYFDEEDYQRLLQTASAASPQAADQDAYEPNDTTPAARLVQDNLLLACLPAGDKDHYQIQMAQGMPLHFHLTVYSGPALAFAVRDARGAVLAGSSSTTGKQVELTVPSDGTYEIVLQPAKANQPTSYYQIAFPEQQSFYLLPPGENTLLRAMHTGASSSQAFAAGQELSLPGRGSFDLHAQAGTPTYAHNEGDTLWSFEQTLSGQRHKHYAWRRQVGASQVLPHVTFRQGWETSLNLAVGDESSSLALAFYDELGHSLGGETLPLTMGRYEGPIATQLDLQLRNRIAWLTIGAPEQKISGFALFQRPEAGDSFSLPLSSRPLNGEMAVFDLKAPHEGATGLSLVNTSGMENLIRYQLLDPQGKLVSSGEFTLLHGEKYLGTAEQLAGPAKRGYHLLLLSQYNVEGMVYQNDSLGTSYGHRLLCRHLDSLNESYLSVSGPWEETQLIVANPSSKGFHVLFEGYSADGTLQGRFHTILGRVIFPWETRHAPLTQILQNGVDLGDLAAITHFRISSLEKVYLLELNGSPQSKARTARSLQPIFANP